MLISVDQPMKRAEGLRQPVALNTFKACWPLMHRVLSFTFHLVTMQIEFIKQYILRHVRTSQFHPRE